MAYKTKDTLKYIDSKRIKLNINSKKYKIKNEVKKENGEIKPFGEDTVIEMTVFFIGDYWICFYVKIQKTEDLNGVLTPKYYYKLRCFSPLRSNNRLTHIFTEKESDIIKLCTNEIQIYIDRISGKINKDEFYNIMENEVIKIVEQRSFALDNSDDIKEKMYKEE